MGNLRKLCTLLLMAAATLPATLSAQERATVSGRVTAQGSGQALAGAQITVQGTTFRTVTNPQGQYRITNIPAGRVTVTASTLGYGARSQTITAAAGQTASLDFTLAASAVALDELVVTGTAGRQERRAQSAQVAQVNAAQIVQDAPVTSVGQILQSRIPGVSVSASSGSAGTAQQIRIRGPASISLSNEPLVFIDGVRADSRIQAVYAVGGQATSRLNDLNPEDIERMEVVKGPAAATLYGSDASAGVIQIFTKRGRSGGGRFSQNVTVEYNNIDPNFTPPNNAFLCTRGDSLNAFQANPVGTPPSTPRTVPSLSAPACGAVAVGTILQDNPLVRESAFRDGSYRSLSWNGQGGGENYGYYLSFGSDDEEGTLSNNSNQRRTGRVNFDFVPSSKLRFDARFGLSDIHTELPISDNQIYGFMGGGGLGSPRTLGGQANGFYAPFRGVEAIAALENLNRTVRTTASLQAGYNPFRWFTNRVTVGADLSRTEAEQFYPRNELNRYAGELNTGSLSVARVNSDRITVDYLGNVSSAFGRDEEITSDLSFGTQVIATRFDQVFSAGTNLPSNAARVVSAAATRSGGQNFNESRQIGILAQEQLGFRDKLFLQLGARLDRSSSFGEQADWFLLPKIGGSYVISEEPFWENNLSFFNTLRVRASYGETGRSPTAGAALETYDPLPYAIVAGSQNAGVVALNPGNANLRPERGKELEAGFEAGFFGDRVGVDLTFFNKRTTDLLLRVPLAPSAGFTQGANFSDPFRNIGEVRNRGIELEVRGRLLDRRNFSVESRLGFNTLDNELVSLGEVSPFGTLNRFTEGRQVGAFYSRRIRSVKVDTVTTAGVFRNRTSAIVSDSLEHFGNLFPTREGSFSTTVTLFRNLRLYGQVDGKWNFLIHSNTSNFRDRQFGNTLFAQELRRDSTSRFEERARLNGPYVSESGVPIAAGEVVEPFLYEGDFMRFRELSATIGVPSRLLAGFGGRNASITFAGRNLKLWTNYPGDPEVVSDVQTSTGAAQFSREEFLTIPQPRRFVVRFNVGF